jgi:hypothetical protein
MYVIGIGGFKRSGKDTFGRLLHEAAAMRGVNTVRTAFADPVRVAAAAAYGFGTNTFGFTSSRTKDVVDPQWGITPRQMMINVGEAMCASDPDHWVKVWRNSYANVGADTLVIVTDVRKIAEAREVITRGGTLALIQRPGVVWDGTSSEWLAHHYAASPHFFDVLVKNDGDVSSLRRHADRIVRRMLDKAKGKKSSK